MQQLIIRGPKKLEGTVLISGSKNAALPIIAATLLFNEKITLRNVPQIKDVFAMLEIIKSLGVSYNFTNESLVINPSKLNEKKPNTDQIKKLRASILLLAPLLVRRGEVRIPHPGGCLIGSRPIDVHLAGLSKMGASVEESPAEYILSTKGFNPCSVTADFSVTGTENLIMAALLTKGETKISLAASEPHVQDFCRFLNKAGALISGIGTHNLVIKGVKKLKAVDYKIIPDQIESGTFAIAAVASRGTVRIKGFIQSHHQSLIYRFDRCNVQYEILSKDEIRMLPSRNIKAFKVRTEIYPGFPTDLQAPMAVLATQAYGSSEIHETIFEGRLGYINELSKMGASCIIRDAHQATVTGPTPLYGARITSFDLRAGATLIIAGIIAQGESRLDQIEIIDRGYQGIEEKFIKLGANIKRVKLKEVD